MNEFAPITDLVLKHARDAFGGPAAVAAQWQALDFTAEPDYAKAVEEYDLLRDEAEVDPIFAGPAKGEYRPRVSQLVNWFKATNRHGKNRMAMTKRDVEVLKTLGYID